MQTQILIQMTPEQLDELFDRRLTKALEPVLAFVNPNPTDLPDYLTRKEVGELLRVSLVTLDRMSDAGTLQKIDFGGSVRYRRDDVLAAMKERKNGKTKR